MIASTSHNCRCWPKNFDSGGSLQPALPIFSERNPFVLIVVIPPTDCCRYVVTCGTSPISSQAWDEGDTDEQRQTRDHTQTSYTPHAEETGHVSRTCRYFGIGTSTFYRWRAAHRKHGEAGLVNRPPIPKWHANRTPVEIEEKVLHLRRKYNLGPMRIVWYLTRYHDIKISDATVSRMLKRNGVVRCRAPAASRGVPCYPAYVVAGTWRSLHPSKRDSRRL